MTFCLQSFTLGPLQNNTYLLGDEVTNQAALVDPGLGIETVLDELHRWKIEQIWFTHAHFDHTLGANALLPHLTSQPQIGLHPADLELYHAGGGSAFFGISTRPGPAPTLHLAHGQNLSLGRLIVQVRHVPGHSPGHVLFYVPALGAALCGDVIFYDSIGRTDLPGGNQTQLLQSIHQQVLTLPDETRLLPGHGPETTVSRERTQNPYL
jgi:glyoxylase-like metal-dependent hydrolase (beta-lactamase superfamily II)